MDFDTWLNERLQELKTDEAVFGPYIKSILEGDEELGQKIEDLEGILGELGDSSLDVNSLRSEILSRWDVHVNAAKVNREEKIALSKSLAAAEGASSLDNQLEKLLRLSPEELAGTSTNNLTDKEQGFTTDSVLRAAILKQYQQDDSDSEEENGTRKASKLEGLDKNTNAERVLSAQKEMKEQSRVDAANKREKDREDRARQKKLVEEKKEKAKKKTAKVERKR